MFQSVQQRGILIFEISLTCKASMNAFVPLLAMVPKLLTRSALVMPIPVSMIVKVLSALFGISSILSSLVLSSFVGSVKLS